MEEKDLFLRYLDYVADSESPIVYHRWTFLSIIGALLGRQLYIPFGHSIIYPNQYIILMGSPGARKGSAISVGQKLLKAVGYNKFAPDTASKEMFIAGMGKTQQDEENLDIEDLCIDDPTETFVIADEMNDFLGQNDLAFCTKLTKLWDNKDDYLHPKLHGKSVYVYKPTVNILGGNTQQNLSLAIPSEAIGNGFCSRILFIHSEPSGRLITFPKGPSQEAADFIIERFKDIKSKMKGALNFSEDGKIIIDKIYKSFIPIDDNRFHHYSTRRFTHFLKICTILSAASLSMTVTKEIALRANTILHQAEKNMPKALGEFGKAKNSGVVATILSYLISNPGPKDMKEIWKVVARDLTKYSDLTDIMSGLIRAEKVQILRIGKKSGYVPLHVETREWDPELVNTEYLTLEEQ